MGTIHRSGVFKKTNDKARLVIATILGIVIGFFIGVSFPSISFYKIHLPSNLRSSFDASIANDQDFMVRSPERTADNLPKISLSLIYRFSGFLCEAELFVLSFCTIYVPTNPRGAELLPPGIVVPESDLYLRRLWGEPSEDLKKKPKYLVTFTVGFDQRNNIDKCVKKFSEDFQILLFHYDGRTTEWDQFEWSKNAIHVSVKKQTKWWYAKRFLHPDVVSAYEYIFIWDEDLGVEHFNAERYIELVKKHGLDISQPGLEPNNGLTWQMTKRRGDREVHKFTEEKPGWCSDPHLPPCAAYAFCLFISQIHTYLCGNYGARFFSGSLEMCMILVNIWSGHWVKCCLSEVPFPNSLELANTSTFWDEFPTFSTTPMTELRMKTQIRSNDLVHGWGLDFALRRCVEAFVLQLSQPGLFWFFGTKLPFSSSQPAHEKIGVVDSQWIIHQVIPSLGSQGKSEDGKPPWEGVRTRCKKEWSMFQNRLANADKAYLAQLGKE
ncbi:Trimethylguanosine synthase [Gossypium australe]|uniref:Trimethylguanosine synthase n=1 Tax=Gossypium australe TaxID=47621 RepID=A0A5B6X6R6_9ROSI|nr:Trimethylguanosine synthase [Gossypium australe]